MMFRHSKFAGTHVKNYWLILMNTQYALNKLFLQKWHLIPIINFWEKVIFEIGIEVLNDNSIVIVMFDIVLTLTLLKGNFAKGMNSKLRLWHLGTLLHLEIVVCFNISVRDKRFEQKMWENLDCHIQTIPPTILHPENLFPLDVFEINHFSH